MATIAIRDLTESVELDRQAMAAIVGGARIGTHFAVTDQAVPPVSPFTSPLAARVVDYPPGFPSARQPVVDDRIPQQSILRK